MADDSDSILRRFRKAATAYIEVVDSAANIELIVFLESVSRCLAELYGSALYLPAVTPHEAQIEEAPFASEDWASLFRALRKKLARTTGIGQSLIRPPEKLL